MDLQRSSVGIGQRPALVLVDMIRGFTSSACPLGTDCPEVVEANAQLLEVFRAKQLPVFFTTVVYHNERQASVFRNRIQALNCLTPESEWVQVDPALSPIEGEALIEKQWASSFFGTDLNAQLRTAGGSYGAHHQRLCPRHGGGRAAVRFSSGGAARGRRGSEPAGP